MIVYRCEGGLEEEGKCDFTFATLSWKIILWEIYIYQFLMSQISDLQNEIKQFIHDRDWSQFHNYKDLSISLSLEASEVLEHFQRKDNDTIDEYVKNNTWEIAEEIADVFYWVLLLSDKLWIDLTEEFRKKMVKNANKYPIEKAKWKSDKYNLL